MTALRRSLVALNTLAACIALARPASAQIRAVNYNTLDKPLSSGDADYRTVFGAIASESVNGIAKRADVIMLQEQGETTTTALAALLNDLHGVSSYVGLQPTMGQPDTDRLGIVYDSSALTLVSAATVVPTGSTRPLLRAGFRPAGYDSQAATLYVYSAHLNASQPALRASEANAMRNNANTLGAAHVIFAGDFNLQNSSEQAYQFLTTGAHESLAFDPVNRPGAWHDTTSFDDLHTQSTRTGTLPDGGAGGGMDDRFDFQLATAELMDGEGLSYIGPTAPGTAAAHRYRAFGNGGNTFNGNINDAANTSKPPGVLNALYRASDHLPVVADYQIPARLAADVAPPAATRVITGATVTAELAVSNAVPAAVAAGADELDYTIGTTGDLSVQGPAVGTDPATGGGNAHTLALDTATPGAARGGTVTVTATSQGADDPAFERAVTVDVLAHARPSWRADEEHGAVQVDFGIVARGLDPDARAVSVHNLDADPGFTAALDVDSVTPEGDAARFATDLAPFESRPAGEANDFSVDVLTDELGTFAATFTLATSDEDLPGATELESLILILNARVATAGDANLDGLVTVGDVGLLATSFGLTQGATWQQGDFNGDGAVTVADVGLLSSNFAGAAAPPELLALPEPGMMVLLSCAAVPAILGRKRKGRLPARQTAGKPAG